MGGGSGGGSSGGFFGSRMDPKKLRQEVEAARLKLEREANAAEVNGMLREQLKYVNDRDGETTQEYRDRITTALEPVVEGTVDLVFGGSVAKHTYVNGLSDVDTLLMIDSKNLKDATPRELLRVFSEMLEDNPAMSSRKKKSIPNPAAP